VPANAAKKSVATVSVFNIILWSSRVCLGKSNENDFLETEGDRFVFPILHTAFVDVALLHGAAHVGVVPRQAFPYRAKKPKQWTHHYDPFCSAFLMCLSRASLGKCIVLFRHTKIRGNA
jgi:hypothetical protein